MPRASTMRQTATLASVFAKLRTPRCRSRRFGAILSGIVPTQGRPRENDVRAFLALMAAGLLYASAASAQDAAASYPNRPIRIIVCVPAGGGVDTVTRIVANGLQKRLRHTVGGGKRAGAGREIGAQGGC